MCIIPPFGPSDTNVSQLWYFGGLCKNTKCSRRILLHTNHVTLSWYDRINKKENDLTIEKKQAGERGRGREASLQQDVTGRTIQLSALSHYVWLQKGRNTCPSEPLQYIFSSQRKGYSDEIEGST